MPRLFLPRQFDPILHDTHLIVKHTIEDGLCYAVLSAVEGCHEGRDGKQLIEVAREQTMQMCKQVP